MTNMPALQLLQALLARHLPSVHRFRLFDVACAFGALYAVFQVSQVARRRMKTTALRGPPSPSWFWGTGKLLLASPDPGLQYEKWAEEYGGVYELPSPLGAKKIMLCDAKAVAHFYAGETKTYILAPPSQVGVENFVGKGILSAIGDNHRRQRKTLTPAFSNASVRNLIPVFYDSAYKAKGAWDSLIESNGGGSAIIEVQNWMNHISLDTIGIAGFSHDFATLDGKKASVAEAFEAFGNMKKDSMMSMVLLAQAIPWLQKLPNPLMTHIKGLNKTMEEIANELLTKSRQEKEAGTLGEREQKSILAYLIKAEGQGAQARLSREEVMAQAKVLIFAGFESTSITMTWALIELARKPDLQTRLRKELCELGTDPTYDQLSNGLPYLDAVTHETLRLHAPLPDTMRMAAEDDVIPLSNPVRTRSGQLVDHISVAKGSYVMVPITTMNCSTALWGIDAKEFKPERWLTQDGIPAAAKEVQGHKHILSFVDGPRTCLGKSFAIAEFKIVLSVLVKKFVFEFVNGPETSIEVVTGILPRPKVVGEEEIAIPLRVRRFE